MLWGLLWPPTGQIECCRRFFRGTSGGEELPTLQRIRAWLTAECAKRSVGLSKMGPGSVQHTALRNYQTARGPMTSGTVSATLGRLEISSEGILLVYPVGKKRSTTLYYGVRVPRLTYIISRPIITYQPSPPSCNSRNSKTGTSVAGNPAHCKHCRHVHDY